MGQYYNIVTFKNKQYRVYDRSLKADENADREYMCAKLTEHSWLKNETMMAVSNLIYQYPTRLAWIGDYADSIKQQYEIPNKDLSISKVQTLYKLAWKGNNETSFIKVNFDCKDKLLVNWTKKQYMSMQEYIKISTDKDGWCLHPLSLLTALGNGQGGGDYYGINKDKIGIWSFDELSFENSENEKELLQDNFTKFIVEFKEN